MRRLTLIAAPHVGLHHRSRDQGRGLRTPLTLELCIGALLDGRAAMMAQLSVLHRELLRVEIAEADIEAVIPAKSNRCDPIPHDKAKYKWRNQIERLFNKHKNWRRIATRYDKTKESYLGFVAVAAVKLWIPFVHER